MNKLLNNYAAHSESPLLYQLYLGDLDLKLNEK